MPIIDTSELLETSHLSADHNEWIYNGLDCAVTLEIFHTLHAQLDEVTAKTYTASRELQNPILEMMMRGVLVDQHRRARVLRQYKEQMDFLTLQLIEIVRDGVGVPVSESLDKPFWRSPHVMKNLFYDVLGLPVQRKKNAKGQMAPTVDREALEKLSLYYIAEPICLRLLLLRDLEKKRQFLETGIDPDGRMRTNFNIAGTNTGRLASAMADYGTGGNLQNIDRDLRSVFIADKGMKFANLDLEQGDSRNLGAICWEKFLESHGEDFAGAYINACESGDLHTTVSRMARPYLPWTEDPKANRKIADTVFYRNMTYRDLDKRLGHGSNYLGAPPTMAKHAKVPTQEVKDFQHNYFTAFPCIPAYHRYVAEQLKAVSNLTTLFGRRRFFFGRPTDPKTQREAVAYAPQSMTAEEINRGMLKLWWANRVQLLVQVHDSILFQYPEELEDEIIPWALATLRVPLTLKRGREFVVPTEAKVGWNWGDVVYNKDGSVKDNPDGLIKWKGQDTRKRQEQPGRLLSVAAMLEI